MAMPVRENVSPLARIHGEIDRLLQEFPMAGFWREPAMRVPTLDLSEKDGNLVIEAELPGIEKKDVKVTYQENAVTIEGESHREKEEKQDGYYRSERHYGSFYRVVPLPAAVDFEKAQAEFKNGMLTVTLPKAPPAPEKTQTIPIAE